MLLEVCHVRSCRDEVRRAGSITQNRVVL